VAGVGTIGCGCHATGFAERAVEAAKVRESGPCGDVGYYSNAKIENPISHERYQTGIKVTLIGSKPD
jgi:hypothetical protein